MTEPIKPPRLTGRLTSMFDPRAAVVTEQVTDEGVILRVEKPRDDQFWAELTLSKEWLTDRLARVRADEVADAQRLAAAAMPAWTPGRELA